MGNRVSSAALSVEQCNSVLSLQPVAGQLFEIYPGLEDQLAQSFLCHCQDGEEELPFSTLEPVLRHHLMQCGLIEVAARFVTSEGKLEETFVTEYLKRANVSTSKPLNLRGWKAVAVAWIEFLHDVQLVDVKKTQLDMRQMQREQEAAYEKAMNDFQEYYLKALETYYGELRLQKEKEAQERAEWEKSSKLQEAFYNAQMGYCQQANDEAVESWNKIVKEQRTVAEEYVKHMQGRRHGPRSLTYSYKIPDGLPVGPLSAGCVPPRSLFSRRVNGKREGRSR